MTDLKLEAESLRLRLIGGWGSIEEAVALADRVIEVSDRPIEPFLELSMAGERHVLDVAALLSRVPGEVRYERAVRSALAALRDWVADDQARGRRAVSCLRTAYFARLFEPEEVGWDADMVVDSYELARDGTYGSEASAFEALRAFFDRHAEPGGSPGG